MQSEDPSLNLICSYRPHIWAERLSRKSEEGSVGSVQVNRWKKKKKSRSPALAEIPLTFVEVAEPNTSLQKNLCVRMTEHPSHGYTPPPNEQLMVPFCQSINALLDKTDTDTHWAPPHQGKEQRHSKQMQIRLLLRDQDSRLKKEDSKDHPK